MWKALIARRILIGRLEISLRTQDQAGVVSNLDEDVVAIQLDGEAGHLGHRIVHALSGGEVVLPSVPWAHDARAVDVAFAERAALMDASVADRVEITARVEECDFAPAGLHHFACALGNFAAAGRLY